MARRRTGTLLLRERTITRPDGSKERRKLWHCQLTVVNPDGTKSRPLYNLETADRSKAQRKMAAIVADLDSIDRASSKPTDRKLFIAKASRRSSGSTGNATLVMIDGGRFVRALVARARYHTAPLPWATSDDAAIERIHLIRRVSAHVRAAVGAGSEASLRKIVSALALEPSSEMATRAANRLCQSRLRTAEVVCAIAPRRPLSEVICEAVTGSWLEEGDKDMWEDISKQVRRSLVAHGWTEPSAEAANVVEVMF